MDRNLQEEQDVDSELAPGEELRKDPAHKGMCSMALLFLLPLAFDLILAILARQSLLALLQLALGLMIVLGALAIWCTGTHSFYRVFYLLVVSMMALQLILIIVKAFVLLFACTGHEGCVASALFYGLSILGNVFVFIFLIILWLLAVRSSEEEKVIASQRRAVTHRAVRQLQSPDEVQATLDAAQDLYMGGADADTEELENQHSDRRQFIADVQRDIDDESNVIVDAVVRRSSLHMGTTTTMTTTTTTSTSPFHQGVRLRHSATSG